ncbi:MAG: hypothetical protein IJZ44_05775 [Lachnospiraceae bacterium]|nr:hypothetical protein [Lachnospiraceae bacterium]
MAYLLWIRHFFRLSWLVFWEARFQRTWYKEGLPKLEKAEGVFFKSREDGIEVWSDAYVHVVEIEGLVTYCREKIQNIPEDIGGLEPFWFSMNQLENQIALSEQQLEVYLIDIVIGSAEVRK